VDVGGHWWRLVDVSGVLVECQWSVGGVLVESWQRWVEFSGGQRNVGRASVERQ
jgi:hypothetical protein